MCDLDAEQSTNPAIQTTSLQQQARAGRGFLLIAGWQADPPAAAKPAPQAQMLSPVDEFVSASPSPPDLPIVCIPQSRQDHHDNEMAAAEE